MSHFQQSDSFEMRFLSQICTNDMRTIRGKTACTIGTLCNPHGKDFPVSATMLEIRVNNSPSCGLTNYDISEILE